MAATASSVAALHAAVCAYVAAQRALPGVDADSDDVCVSVLRELWHLPAEPSASASPSAATSDFASTAAASPAPAPVLAPPRWGGGGGVVAFVVFVAFVAYFNGWLAAQPFPKLVSRCTYNYDASRDGL